MHRPRFTIAGGMIAVAAVAAFLALARNYFAMTMFLTLLLGSIALGRFTKRVCLPRPRLIVPLNLGILAVGFLWAMLGASTSEPTLGWSLFLGWLVLAEPVILGSSLAWMTLETATGRAKVHRGDFWAALFIAVMMILPLCVVVPLYILIFGITLNATMSSGGFSLD